MNKLLGAIACAAALCAVGASQAAVLTFNDPGVIDIDNNTNIATYTEGGFALSGPAASFLPLDATLVGGIDGATFLSLMAVGGGAFSLLAADYAFYDLGFGAAPGMLSVTGLRNGMQVASQTFTLGALSSVSFGAAFGNLTGVTFSGTTGFALDNLNAVPVTAPIPEPATVVLTAVGLLGVMLGANRRRKRA